MGRYNVSERRACRLVGQHRSAQRYVPLPNDYEARLVKEMRRLAEAHPRWGYRQIHALLVEEGWKVNRKRIERLWRLEGLKVPPSKSKKSGKKAGGGSQNAIWNLPAIYPDHIWSFDFMTDRLVDGTAFRILNIVDEYTRICVEAYVARNIGARRVIWVLERLFAQGFKPKIIRSDNGREFVAGVLELWLAERDVTSAFVEKGSPSRTPSSSPSTPACAASASTSRSSTASSKPEWSSPNTASSTTPCAATGPWACSPRPSSPGELAATPQSGRSWNPALKPARI